MRRTVYTSRDLCDIVGGMSDDLEKATDLNFAANLRARREAAGISKAEFVRRLADLGWSSAHQTTLTRIEDGERPARLGEARLIARALRVPLHLMMREPEVVDLTTRLEQRSYVLTGLAAQIARAATDFVILAQDHETDLEQVGGGALPEGIWRFGGRDEAADRLHREVDGGISMAHRALDTLDGTQEASEMMPKAGFGVRVQRARDLVTTKGLKSAPQQWEDRTNAIDPE